MSAREIVEGDLFDHQDVMDWLSCIIEIVGETSQETLICSILTWSGINSFSDVDMERWTYSYRREQYSFLSCF